MIKFIAHKLEARSLERQQRRAVAELQSIFDERAALAQREAYLMRFSAALAVRELDRTITARRVARQHRVGA
jgi:hypothetical protein